MKLRHTVIALSAALLFGSAHAANYSVALGGIASNSYASGSLNGVFDLQNLGIDFASIANVQFSASFVDDLSDGTSVAQTNGGVERVPYRYMQDLSRQDFYSRNNVYLQTETTYYTKTVSTDAESFNVVLGGAVVGGGGTSAQTSTQLGDPISSAPRRLDIRVDQTLGPFSCGRNCSYTVAQQDLYFTDFYSVTDTVAIDRTGPMSTSFALASASPSSLAQLRSTGQLFTTFNLTGDAVYQTASLTFTANPVPEPETWAMMAGGLLAVFGIGRRRQKAAHAALQSHGV